MKPQGKFNNGDIVKDTISKYQGTIIGTTLWLNGCYRYVVQSGNLDKEGKPIEASFDEMQLELVKANTIKTNHETGGPWPSPTRR